MHLRSDGVLPPSSTRTVERRRESIPTEACKVLIDLVSGLSLLQTIYQIADEITRQMRPAQSFASMNAHLNPSVSTSATHSNNQERQEIPQGLEEVNLEDISIHFLCIYSAYPNWKQMVSSCNEYGQTMAHICVTLGYFRLLQHLFTWQINLNVVDNMGLTALHYAYLFRQEECARLLIRSGANPFILDDLGRSPSNLNPSLEVMIHPDTEIGADSSTPSISPADRTVEMPEEAEMLYAKHFLVQQWRRKVEDERSEMRETPPPSGVSSVAYSPDGGHIISGSFDNTIKTDAAVGKPLEGHTRYRMQDICGHPDAASTASTSDSADEMVGRVMPRESLSSTIQISQGTHALAASQDMEALSDTAVPSAVLSAPVGASSQAKVDVPRPIATLLSQLEIGSPRPSRSHYMPVGQSGA